MRKLSIHSVRWSRGMRRRRGGGGEAEDSRDYMHKQFCRQGTLRDQGEYSIWPLPFGLICHAKTDALHVHHGMTIQVRREANRMYPDSWATPADARTTELKLAPFLSKAGQRSSLRHDWPSLTLNIVAVLILSFSRSLFARRVCRGLPEV